MDKICTISLLLAFVLAIVCAFVVIPESAAILLILGGIGALNTAEKPDLRVRIYLSAIVLTLGAKSLTDIPAVGTPLASIFAGVATLFVGASVVAITLAVAHTAKANLTKTAAP